MKLPANGSFSDPIVLDEEGEEDKEDKDEDEKTWPADFHAMKIYDYFTAMKKCPASISAAALFFNHFGLWYCSSTVYDHCDCWLSAPQSERDAILTAGQTPAGLWSVFMERNLVKDADTKAMAWKMRWKQKFMGIDMSTVLTILGCVPLTYLCDIKQ